MRCRVRAKLRPVCRAPCCLTLPEDWLQAAFALGCVAVVCNHSLWNSGHVEKVHDAGLRALSYTVNEPPAAQRLIALGTDGIITDRVDLFSPA